MKTFIRVAEVWVPSADGSLLELGGGLFDAAPAFGEISRTSAVAQVARGSASPADERSDTGSRPLLALPVVGDDVVSEVIALYF